MKTTSLAPLAWILLGCASEPGLRLPLPDDPLAADHPFPATRQIDPGSGRLRLPAAVLDPDLAPEATVARSLFAGLGDKLGELDGAGTTAIIRAPIAGEIDPASIAVEVVPLAGADTPAFDASVVGSVLEVRPRGAWQGGATYALIVSGARTPDGELCEPADLTRSLLGGEALDDPELEAERRRVEPALSGRETAEVCLVFSFRIETTGDWLLALRELLAARAGADPPQATIDAILAPAEVPGLESAEFVDRVVYGTYSSPDLRGDDGLWVPARLAADEPSPVAAVPFAVAIPRQRAGVSPPFPVVMGLHGLGGSIDSTLPHYADLLAAAGFAYVIIDGVGHGSRAEPGTAPQLAFLDLDDPRRPRDMFRQTVADLLQLRLTLAHGALLGDVLQPDRIRWTGGSYGGIFGVIMAAADPEIEAVHAEGCGGPWRDVVLGTEISPLLRSLFADRAGLDAYDPATQLVFERYFELGQWVIDPGDPSALAEYVLRRPLAGARRRILMQYWVGETLMPNLASERLAAALGAPIKAAADDPGGVASVWPYEVSEWGVEPGTGAHGAFQDIPAARKQAIDFLLSHGTTIAAPPD